MGRKYPQLRYILDLHFQWTNFLLTYFYLYVYCYISQPKKIWQLTKNYKHITIGWYSTRGVPCIPRLRRLRERGMGCRRWFRGRRRALWDGGVQEPLGGASLTYGSTESISRPVLSGKGHCLKQELNIRKVLSVTAYTGWPDGLDSLLKHRKIVMITHQIKKFPSVIYYNVGWISIYTVFLKTFKRLSEVSLFSYTENNKSFHTQ